MFEVKIDGQKMTNFEEFEISMNYDSIAWTFSLTGSFNPDNPTHKAAFQPWSYKPIQLFNNGLLLLTGKIIDWAFGETPEKNTVRIAGYSLPGVLEDCEIPESAYPLQSDDMSLVEIAWRVTDPFDLTVSVDDILNADADTVYKTVTARATQKVKDFLAELASQRKIILSTNPEGELVFTRPNAKGESKATFATGQQPMTRIRSHFPGQSHHSEVTVLKQPGFGDDEEGNSACVQNLTVSGFRPHIREQRSGAELDTEKVASAVMGAEIAQNEFSITLDRWQVRDIHLLPGDVITVFAPGAYVFSPTRLFIRSLSFSGSSQEMTANIIAVLPDSFGDSYPMDFLGGAQ